LHKLQIASYPAGMLETPLDRRELKKLATHRALASAARELTLERGLDAITVDEIAAAAGVSPRTFFNYFSCKEEAIVGVEPWMIQAMADEVRRRPDTEDPFTALLAVLAADEDSEIARRWTARAELAGRYPELIPRQMAGLIQFERALTAAIGARLGVDPDVDPYPGLVVAWAVATLRSTLEWWIENDRPVHLREALHRAFVVLAEGVSWRPGVATP
jgi:AcrR family transcriptional regulator